MSYQGDIPLGNTINFTFTTRQATGAPTTLAGTPSVACYVGSSTTELTAGVTLTVDFDGRTGLNLVTIVASGGNGYATTTDINVVITAGTVNSVSVVGETVGSFSIENRSALRPTTVSRTLDVSATGEAGVDWANVGSPTTSLALTGTTIATTQKVDVETIKTNPVVNGGTITFPTNSTVGTSTLTQTQVSGGAYALSSASFAFNAALDFTTAQKAATLARVTLVDTITTYTGNTLQTGDSYARIGAAGVGLTNVVLPSGGLANVTAWTVALTGNITGNLSGSVGSVTSLTAATVTSAATRFLTMIETDGGAGFEFTTQALTNAPTGGSAPTADQNAAALLKLDWTTVTGEADRSALNAFRFLRNGFSISGSTLTVLKEDDTTAAYTRTITSDPSAVPITGID